MWTYHKTWNFLMRRFMGEVNVCFSFWTWLNRVLKNETPRKLANIWKIDGSEINAIEFDRTQTHFCWLSWFHCHPCWTEWSPFLLSLSSVQHLWKYSWNIFWSITFEACVACEQALHLGDIVWSHARAHARRGREPHAALVCFLPLLMTSLFAG